MIRVVRQYAAVNSRNLGVLAHEGHLAAGHAPRRTETIQDGPACHAIIFRRCRDWRRFGGFDRANRNYLSLSRRDESIADEGPYACLSKLVYLILCASLARRIARMSDYYYPPRCRARLLTFEDHTENMAKKAPALHQKMMR